MTFTVSGLTDLPRAAQTLLPVLRNARVVALHGAMGAGKTTLIKAVCEAAGVSDVVNSPTFSLVNEYCAEDGTIIYHFDFYRIEHIEEAYDLGYEEYFYGGNLCIVEWPEKILTLLPPDTLHVTINIARDGRRVIRW